MFLKRHVFSLLGTLRASGRGGVNPAAVAVDVVGVVVEVVVEVEAVETATPASRAHAWAAQTHLRILRTSVGRMRMR
jgi:hypothetical protein